MEFVNFSSAKLIFGLDLFPRNKTDGRWDPSGARDLLKWSIDRGWGKLFFGFELGNEDDENNFTPRAGDFMILQELV